MLEKHIDSFQWVNDLGTAREAIEQVVLSDPRSVYRKKKMSNNAFGFHFGTHQMKNAANTTLT
jgi:hypothetical protein